MVYFIVIVVFILIAIWVTQESKRRDEEEDRKRWVDKIDRKKALEKETLEKHTSDVENLYSKNSTEPVLFEIDDLPNDFHEVEYTAFDFETGNKDPFSAFALGIAHFKGNQLLEVHEFTFSPYDEADFIFTNLHGVKREDVIDLPPFSAQFEEISRHLNNKLLVAHNAEFDTDIMKCLLTVVNKRLIKTKISCTYKLAKRFMRHEPSYKLGSLCEYYKIPYWSHKAAYDAVSAGILFMHCLAMSPGGSVTEGAMRGRAVALKPLTKQELETN